MLDDSLVSKIKLLDSSLGTEAAQLTPPAYNPKTHYLELSDNNYFRNLIVLRHIVKLLSESYMSDKLGGTNVDLFMLTPSVSSPMGPGSDSEAIAIQFGDLETFLTDSSQFGFEPLVMNGLDNVYCYLPSMRGENPDSRHLNQFFHCEIELKGDLNKVIAVAEGYVKYLAAGLMECTNLLARLSKDGGHTKDVLAKLTAAPIKRYTFDEACTLLTENGHGEYITSTPHGRDISSKGELALMEVLGTDMPIWMTHFDRDRVPFYQKPDPSNSTKVLNGDLLFPPLFAGGFGGEILGSGQRQDDPSEMRASLEAQGLSADPYEWYIDLRTKSNYQMTAGFGLGIERFIAWSLGLDNIRDAIIYPRLKNVLTTP